MTTTTVTTVPTKSSPVADIGSTEQHLGWDTLREQLIENPLGSPADGGTIGLIVKRPATNARQVVESATVSKDGGMSGSHWKYCEKTGVTDQICVMSCEAIRAIANGDDPDAWALAGDQLFMDFDLTKNNLKVHDKVVVGDYDTGVVLQVTTKPHYGCAKFAKRYGADALKVVNCPEGKRRRLRGIYFHVIRGGVISTGDPINKLMQPSDDNTVGDNVVKVIPVCDNSVDVDSDDDDSVDDDSVDDDSDGDDPPVDAKPL